MWVVTVVAGWSEVWSRWWGLLAIRCIVELGLIVLVTIPTRCGLGLHYGSYEGHHLLEHALHHFGHGGPRLFHHQLVFFGLFLSHFLNDFSVVRIWGEGGCVAGVRVGGRNELDGFHLLREYGFKSLYFLLLCRFDWG